ncbi:hypothetical protein ABBQ38_006252 [Trebouxia sp. C0009 RCD-2024]
MIERRMSIGQLGSDSLVPTAIRSSVLRQRLGLAQSLVLNLVAGFAIIQKGLGSICLVDGQLSQRQQTSPRKTWARPRKQGVHFAPGAPQAEKWCLFQRVIPKKFPDVTSYNDEELETLDVTESCCQPCAEGSPLAVSNCHMLKFLAQLGHQKARRNSGLVRQGSCTDPATADMKHGSGHKPGSALQLWLLRCMTYRKQAVAPVLLCKMELLL